MEPTEFDPKWWSHKFNGPGLRYEVALCIRTGDIVWVNGGLPCGEWPDLRLARNAFIDCLQPGEKALADAGYRDQQYFELSNNDPQKQRILARHENVNARIKLFCCMKDRFRHALSAYSGIRVIDPHITSVIPVREKTNKPTTMKPTSEKRSCVYIKF